MLVIKNKVTNTNAIIAIIIAFSKTLNTLRRFSTIPCPYLTSLTNPNSFTCSAVFDIFSVSLTLTSNVSYKGLVLSDQLSIIAESDSEVSFISSAICVLV